MRIVFEDDDDRAAFVRWHDHIEGSTREMNEAASEALRDLLDAGWTRHGYVGEELVPPGKYYDHSFGILDADDPRAIAGRWTCLCGFETDRLAHAEGHTRRARECPERLQGDPPHEITEHERRGPEHNDRWKD